MGRMVTQKKMIGNFFVFVALAVIGFIYWTAVQVFYQVLKEGEEGIKRKMFLVLFHLMVGLVICCFFKTMLTDPGTVPPLWGFHMGDVETKRRRYCLVCHVFKPQRCHHCSICNRCVLNMDHHCRNEYIAWINNCVGFFNRKSFILLLFYVVLSTLLVAGGLFSVVFNLVTLLLSTKNPPSYSEASLLCVYLLNCLLFVTLTVFLRFHVRLILNNSTTIESLNKSASLISYNKSVKENWEQVFGSNKWLWFVPFTFKSGKPVGDGVVWTAAAENEIDDIPSDEGYKRNSSTFEEQQRRVGSEDMLHTSPDANNLQTALTKSGNLNLGVKPKSKVFEDILFSPAD